MCWCVVQIKVVFLDVLAVVALAIRQPEEALFKDWIVAVPHGHAKAEQLLVIADASNAILTPVVSARPGLVMGKVVPGISVFAVVFTNCAPLAFAQVRPPLHPVGCAVACIP